MKNKFSCTSFSRGVYPHKTMLTPWLFTTTVDKTTLFSEIPTAAKFSCFLQINPHFVVDYIRHILILWITTSIFSRAPSPEIARWRAFNKIFNNQYLSLNFRQNVDKVCMRIENHPLCVWLKPFAVLTLEVEKPILQLQLFYSIFATSKI